MKYIMIISINQLYVFWIRTTIAPNNHKNDLKKKKKRKKKRSNQLENKTKLDLDQSKKKKKVSTQHFILHKEDVVFTLVGKVHQVLQSRSPYNLELQS